MIRKLLGSSLARAMFVVGLFSGCAAPEVAQGINDPYEAHNRAIHDFNRSVDKVILRPTSQGYGNILPVPVQHGVGNFAGNLGLPSSILNNLLQADIDGAANNLTRLLINTTLGLGGVLDPASAWGLHARDADFGQTLHVWGFAEGHYVELPLLGPSTKRDTIGGAVDLITDPVAHLLPAPERYVAPVAAAASKVGDRYRFGGTIDSILYESADSYAQARLLYLESRRFQLGGALAGSEGELDPYADLDGIDPYAE